MKVVKKLSICLLIVCLILSGCNSKDSEKSIDKGTLSNDTELVLKDKFAEQNEVDAQLQAEAAKGNPLDEAMVVVDPYNASPLTAVVIFSTDKETGGKIIVKGKSKEDNITGSFQKAKEHIVPVYGLYSGDTTEIEIITDEGQKTTVTATTEKIDFEIDDISVNMIDESKYNYDQLSVVYSTTGASYMLDSKGDIRWYYTDGGNYGVEKLANGHLMVPTTYVAYPNYYMSGIQEIDLLGKIYNEYDIPGGQHHEITELSNGNFLVVSDAPDYSSLEDYIVEIDRKTGDVVWELDMKDIMDTTDGLSASLEIDGSEETDWFHNNGLYYDEEKDLILLSARHIDAIVAVEKSTKEIKWILGDPAGWKNTDKSLFFTPVGDDFEWQYAQHNVSMLKNGDILLFDNGTAKVKADNIANKVKGDDVYSRAVVYRIDTEKMTVAQVWQYGKERGPEWYSDWMSGVESLDGTTNDIWITAGTNIYDKKTDSYDFGNMGQFKEGVVMTTHLSHVIDNELAYEIKISGKNRNSISYRGGKLDMYSITYDAEAKPELKGSMGVKAKADMKISEDSLSKAKTISDFAFEYDKMKIALSGSYTAKTGSKVADSYVVLVSTDGKQHAFALNQSSTDTDENIAVSVNGWVSPESIEQGSYDVYLSLNASVYNTGYFVTIK